MPEAAAATDALVDPGQAARFRALGWWRDRTYLDDFDDAVAAYPDKVAIVGHRHDSAAPPAVVSFRQLHRTVDRFAGALLELGVQPGQIVSVQLPNEWTFAALSLACGRIGAVINPLVPIFRDRELSFILGRTESPVVIVPSTFRGYDHAAMLDRVLADLPSGTRGFAVGLTEATGRVQPFEAHFLQRRWEDEGDPGRLRRHAITADQVAELQFTSGTTGEPKGVVHTHDGVAASARATSEHLGIDPAAHHWLACLPLAHIGGLSVICRALWAGTGLTVIDGFDPKAALDSEATHVSLVPTALQRLGAAADRFERIVLGGSAPPEALAPNVSCTYGLTETGSGVVYDGWPLPGVELIERDGELLIRGPMLLRAYRNGTDPRTSDGWLPTGDAGAVDPVSGFVQVFGRRDDLIITGAQKVWPDPVEKILAGMEGVGEVAVVGRPHPEWGQQVTAVVVAQGTPPSLQAMRDAVKAELAAYHAPGAVEFVDVLPRTALGKIRRALV